MTASSHAEDVTRLREERSIAVPRQIYWLGFAAAREGCVFRSENGGGDELQARQNAKNQCEIQTESTCRGGAFVADSNMGDAQDGARMKSAASDVYSCSCREIYSY